MNEFILISIVILGVVEYVRWRFIVLMDKKLDRIEAKLNHPMIHVSTPEAPSPPPTKSTFEKHLEEIIKRERARGQAAGIKEAHERAIKGRLE